MARFLVGSGSNIAGTSGVRREVGELLWKYHGRGSVRASMYMVNGEQFVAVRGRRPRPQGGDLILSFALPRR